MCRKIYVPNKKARTPYNLEQRYYIAQHFPSIIYMDRLIGIYLFIYSVARFLSELIMICASFHIAITNYREILEDGQLWF